MEGIGELTLNAPYTLDIMPEEGDIVCSQKKTGPGRYVGMFGPQKCPKHVHRPEFRAGGLLHGQPEMLLVFRKFSPYESRANPTPMITSEKLSR